MISAYVWTDPATGSKRVLHPTDVKLMYDDDDTMLVRTDDSSGPVASTVDSVPAEQYIHGALAMAKLTMLATHDDMLREIENAMRMFRKAADRQRQYMDKALTYGTKENRQLVEALHEQHEARKGGN